MSALRPPVVPLAAAVAATLALPWLGAWWHDPPLAASAFEFPPRLEVPTEYPRWSWGWCIGVLSPFAMLAVAWWRHPRQARDLQVTAPRVLRRRFPWWGQAALLWTACWWGLAWTRFEAFAGLQRHTFFPLWLGFIVAVNAATFARGARPLLCQPPWVWVRLFLASAAFWWGFEWLNRFVRNWHYLGVGDFGPVAYAVHASLCFSTVLPAVVAVREWLGTAGGLQRVLADGPALGVLSARPAGPVLMAAGLAALLLTGAWPEQLYPTLWLAPVLLVVGRQVRAGRPGWWTELASGDWRTAGSWALAALICGGFWEMWNYHSLARWIYTVPQVDRWHVFEMPLLGYLGYLAFGLECSLAVAAVMPPAAASTRRAPAD